ncbi:MAG: peptidoglycan-binding protein [Patescibacteria group bacterium]|nr:peptidoglycan-binding protein [Patescibacteria group bacterium]
MKKILLASSIVLTVLGLVAATAYASAPTITAGAAQSITLPTSSVSLTGSATAQAPATAIASYAWVLTSGPVVSPAVVITQPNPTTSANATATGLTVPGTYVFTLTATDNATPTAFSATATTTVTVNPAPVVTVNAGANQTITLPTNNVNLSGSATATSPATIASYTWTQVSGPVTAVIAAPSNSSTAVSGLTAAGTYVFKLTATDNTTPTALTGSADVTIVVNSSTTNLPAGCQPGALYSSTTGQPCTTQTQTHVIKSKLEINSNGDVNLTGELMSNTGTVLTVKVWGMIFTINTANVNTIGQVQNLSSFAVGDQVSVNGQIDTTSSTPTVNARSIRDDINSNNNPTSIGNIFSRELLMRGMMGDDVKKIQKLLGLSEDGVFGLNTANKVKEWQSKKGLHVDGILGKQSLGEMEKEIETEGGNDNSTNSSENMNMNNSSTINRNNSGDN